MEFQLIQLELIKKIDPTTQSEQTSPSPHSVMSLMYQFNRVCRIYKHGASNIKHHNTCSLYDKWYFK